MSGRPRASAALSTSVPLLALCTAVGLSEGASLMEGGRNIGIESDNRRCWRPAVGMKLASASVGGPLEVSSYFWSSSPVDFAYLNPNWNTELDFRI